MTTAQREQLKNLRAFVSIAGVTLSWERNDSSTQVEVELSEESTQNITILPNMESSENQCLITPNHLKSRVYYYARVKLVCGEVWSEPSNVFFYPPEKGPCDPGKKSGGRSPGRVSPVRSGERSEVGTDGNDLRKYKGEANLSNGMKTLEEYRLSLKTGCSQENPRDVLDSYYAPWMKAIGNASRSLEVKCMQRVINKMPTLSTESLRSHDDLRLAHNILTLLAAAYVWQDYDDETVKPPQSIPPCLAIPLVDVSNQLGLNPIICYHSVVLANWTYRPGFDRSRKPEYEDVDILFSLLIENKDNWDAFFKIGLLTEFEFAPAHEHVLNAIAASKRQDPVDLEKSLDTLSEIIKNVEKIMPEFHKKLDPDVFYTHIRPFVSGWLEEEHHPEGMRYEGTDLPKMHYAGGSNAQSLIFQIMDALLGMEFSNQKTKTFMNDMLNYMIKEHRQFIQDIKMESRVRQFAMDSQRETLKIAYNNCLDAVCSFRSYHIRIVTSFILTPSRRMNPNQNAEGERGTGGSNLMILLKGIRDDTKKMKIPLKSNL